MKNIENKISASFCFHWRKIETLRFVKVFPKCQSISNLYYSTSIVHMLCPISYIALLWARIGASQYWIYWIFVFEFYWIFANKITLFWNNGSLFFIVINGNCNSSRHNKQLNNINLSKMDKPLLWINKTSIYECVIFTFSIKTSLILLIAWFHATFLQFWFLGKNFLANRLLFHGQLFY